MFRAKFAGKAEKKHLADLLDRVPRLRTCAEIKGGRAEQNYFCYLGTKSNQTRSIYVVNYCNNKTRIIMRVSCIIFELEE